MTTSTVKQQAVAETSTCSLASAELTAILYALEYARKTLPIPARVYVGTTSREALLAIRKGHKVGRRRGRVLKIAEVVLEMEEVGHRGTVLLGPSDKGIHGVAEAKQVAISVIDNSSELTAALAERVREMSGLLRLAKAERAHDLHTNQNNVCVKHYNVIVLEVRQY